MRPVFPYYNIHRDVRQQIPEEVREIFHECVSLWLPFLPEMLYDRTNQDCRLFGCTGGPEASEG